MQKNCRLVLYIITGLGAVRAIFLVLYTSYQLASPIETHPLEAEMVHLSWRVQTGLSLYPQWESYPHVANFFAPLYFWCIGCIGHVINANLRDLFLIGRVATVSFNLLTTLSLGAFLYQRYGGRAALMGTIVSLGPTPLYGFGVMVRPDVMADFLGIAGFLLSIQPRRRMVLLGGALLVAACLTKQTAGMYLLASLIATWLDPALRRFGWLLTGWTIVLLAIAVICIQIYEPHSLGCWFEEAHTPLQGGLSTLQHLLNSSPDLLITTGVGTIAWLWCRPREINLAVLAIVLLLVCLVTSAKLGSDLNYFLGLRSVEALALGKLWHASATFNGRRTYLAAGMLVLIALSMFPSVHYAESQSMQKREQAAYLATPRGRAMIDRYYHVLQLADDPKVQILTDSGMFALRQRERAAFVDPWLFRMLVNTGRLDPAVIEGRLRSQAYDVVVLTSDIDSSKHRYEDYIFGLPERLVRVMRGRYKLVDYEAGFCIYYPVRRLP